MDDDSFMNEDFFNKCLSCNFEHENKIEDLMSAVSIGSSTPGFLVLGQLEENNELNSIENNWQFYEDSNLNENKRKDILESELDKKTDKSLENSAEKENNVLIELSPAENDKLNNSNTNHESNIGLDDNSESYNIAKKKNS